MVTIREKTGRRIVMADGFTSGATGIGLLAMPGAVARVTGAPSALVVAAIGLGLVLFGVMMLWLTRRQPSRGGTLLAAALNLAWVAGSVAVTLVGGLTKVGALAVGLVGVVVLAFAALELQFLPARGGRVTHGDASTPRVKGTRQATLVILVAGLSTVSFGSQAAPATKETSVRAVVDHMIEAWNAGDPLGVGALFTSNGILIAGNGDQRIGPTDIGEYFAGLVPATLPTGTRFTHTVTEVRFVHHDVALVLSEGGFLLPGETTVAPERRGLQSFFLVRNGGAWQAVLVQRTRFVPPNPAGQ